MGLLSCQAQKTKKHSCRNRIQHAPFALAQRGCLVRQKLTFLGLSNGRVCSAVLWDTRDSGGATQGPSSIVKSSASLFGMHIQDTRSNAIMRGKWTGNLMP